MSSLGRRISEMKTCFIKNMYLKNNSEECMQLKNSLVSGSSPSIDSLIDIVINK